MTSLEPSLAHLTNGTVIRSSRDFSHRSLTQPAAQSPQVLGSRPALPCRPVLPFPAELRRCEAQGAQRSSVLQPTALRCLGSAHRGAPTRPPWLMVRSILESRLHGWIRSARPGTRYFRWGHRSANSQKKWKWCFSWSPPPPPLFRTLVTSCFKSLNHVRNFRCSAGA